MDNFPRAVGTPLGFNRTKVELKYLLSFAKPHTIVCFNRTKVELKFFKQKSDFSHWNVLIVPRWN